MTAIIAPRRRNISSVFPKAVFHFFAVKNANTILPSGMIINKTDAVKTVRSMPSPIVNIINAKETEGRTIERIELSGALYSVLFNPI